MDVKAKCILITGAASGLGEATARLLAEDGARLILGDVQERKGEELARELGSSARFQKVDVIDSDSVRKVAEGAREEFGGLYGVVNCAGIVLARKILGKEGPHDVDSFRRVIEVNLVGTFNVLRWAASVMKENEPDPEGERGVIVNTSSVAAFEGQIGQAAYASSKGAVRALTLPASRELARYGIRVVSIAPGIFDTPMMASLPESARSSLGQQVPFPSRLGKPREYALLVRHIFENPMLNGATLRLDGALRMGPR